MPAEVRAAPLRSFTRSKYRLGQFLRGLRTAVAPEDAHTIVALLSAAELDLFLSMRPRDRRHAVETMRGVRRLAADEGPVATTEVPVATTDVLVAALLHDVGKGRLRVEDRVLYVLLRSLSPALVDRCAAAEGARWRVALWRLRHHAAVGAARLEAIGSAPRVIELTAIHHLDDPPGDDRELRWLLAADEAA